MSERLAVGLAFFAFGVNAVTLGAFLLVKMIGEINLKRAEKDIIPYSRVLTPRVFEILKEHRALYPDCRPSLYVLLIGAFSAIGTVAFWILVSALPRRG
jgi:hypothetical protein